MTLFLIGLPLALMIAGSVGIYAKQILIDDAAAQTGGHF